MTFQPTRPTAYTGVRAQNPINIWNYPRDPGSQDVSMYVIGDFWRNTETFNIFILANTGASGAVWLPALISGLATLTGNAGGAVTPNLSNINVIGAAAGAITFTNTGSPNLEAQVEVDGVTITIVGNQLVAAGSSAGFTWQTAAGPTAAAVNNGYIATGALGLTLPAAFGVGDEIEAVAIGAAVLTIGSGAATMQVFGSSGTSAVSSGTGCAIKFVGAVANTTWVATSSGGNFTVT